MVTNTQSPIPFPCKIEAFEIQGTESKGRHITPISLSGSLIDGYSFSNKLFFEISLNSAETSLDNNKSFRISMRGETEKKISAQFADTLAGAVNFFTDAKNSASPIEISNPLTTTFTDNIYLVIIPSVTIEANKKYDLLLSLVDNTETSDITEVFVTRFIFNAPQRLELRKQNKRKSNKDLLPPTTKVARRRNTRPTNSSIPEEWVSDFSVKKPQKKRREIVVPEELKSNFTLKGNPLAIPATYISCFELNKPQDVQPKS